MGLVRLAQSSGLSGDEGGAGTSDQASELLRELCATVHCSSMCAKAWTQPLFRTCAKQGEEGDVGLLTCMCELGNLRGWVTCGRLEPCFPPSHSPTITQLPASGCRACGSSRVGHKMRLGGHLDPYEVVQIRMPVRSPVYIRSEAVQVLRVSI